MLEEILLQVNRPAQYIGQEWNASKKDFLGSKIKFALCFPDLYEVGMSNLGIRILYYILNNVPDTSCERCFACGPDMENILRSGRKEIFSLESKRPLKEFDIIGFSLGSELGYTNVLNILDMGNIPLESSRRDNRHPLVIAGGPCVLNPEPMHEFIDLFVIGEAEDLILEVLDIYRTYQQDFQSGKMHREDLLQQFSGLEGVYVPMFYAVGYDAQGNISSFRPRIGASPRIKKRIVKDLDSSPYPLDWLLPYIQIIHDRISLELMRGCPHRCRFCQAKSQYFPLRYRNPQRLLALAQGAYASCGYEEISLAGLSVTDYPHLKELLQGLIADFKSKAVGISLPSIKPKPGLGELSALLAKIKKTGLTFAPEAGTEALRAVLGKDFSLEDFFKSLEESYRCGYQRVKLYFMLGLPFEKDTDLDAIIDFSQRVSQIRRKACGHSAEVNISVNAFVPKPHTPLQWLGMDTLEAIRGKQNYLKDKARDRKLKLSFHNCEMSFLEGVLSRGDRRLSRVVLAAYQGGARFDAWSNSFRFDVWMDAFKNSRLDPVFYLRRIPEDALLAWDFIDMGTEKGSLREEFNKVIAAE